MAARRRTSRSNRRSAPRRPNTALAEGVYDAVLDGSAIDADDWQYRSLTGGPRGNNLPAFKHEKALSIAQYLYRTNPVGNRLVTLLVDFVVGESVAYACKNEQVTTVIDRHWRDPYNDWDRYMAELFTSYLVFGELLMPLFPNTQDGHMRVGQMLPDRIKAVITDPENWRVIDTVKIKSDTGADDGPVYNVVNVRDGGDALDVAKPALFWKRNNPFGSRGLSILYPLADFIDLLDQMLFSEVERWLLLKAFVWVITVSGIDSTQLAKFKKDNPELSMAPKPGSVWVKNDGITIEAVHPALDTADAVGGMQFLRNHILGSVGLPEHWFGEGGDVNRAVGTVMAEVPRKMLSRLQDELRFIVTDVLQAQVDYAVLAGTLPAMVAVQDSQGQDTEEMIPARDAVVVQMPDLSGDDVAQLTTALQTLTSTLALAESEEYITKDTARKGFLTVLGQVTGQEINADEEAQRAQAEAEERKAQAEQIAQAQQPPIALAAMAPRGQRPGDQQSVPPQLQQAGG